MWIKNKVMTCSKHCYLTFCKKKKSSKIPVKSDLVPCIVKFNNKMVASGLLPDGLISHDNVNDFYWSNVTENMFKIQYWRWNKRQKQEHFMWSDVLPQSIRAFVIKETSEDSLFEMFLSVAEVNLWKKSRGELMDIFTGKHLGIVSVFVYSKVCQSLLSRTQRRSLSSYKGKSFGITECKISLHFLMALNGPKQTQ